MLYETAADDEKVSGNYPTADGSPAFAVYEGLPDSGDCSWMASAKTNNTKRYWLWRSSSTYDYNCLNSYEMFCVLP
tara:strand:+ start:902 stop:1129 length:228 start_codon:yes stop_codon:yes gene_type:complete